MFLLLLETLSMLMVQPANKLPCLSKIVGLQGTQDLHNQGPEFTAPPFQAISTCTNGIKPVPMQFVSTSMEPSRTNYTESCTAIILRMLVMQMMLLILPPPLPSLLQKSPSIKSLEFHQVFSPSIMICFIQFSFWPILD